MARDVGLTRHTRAAVGIVRCPTLTHTNTQNKLINIMLETTKMKKCGSHPDVKRGAEKEPFQRYHGKYGRSRRSYLKRGFGPDGGRDRAVALVHRLYDGLRGAGRHPVPLNPSKILNHLVVTEVIDGRYRDTAQGGLGLPCSLTAFASAFPNQRQICRFYEKLVKQGLHEDNARGPSGGMTLAGMVSALQEWEAGIFTDPKPKVVRPRGMDLHQVNCRGGTFISYDIVYRTRLRDGAREQIIVYINDESCNFAHFCAVTSLNEAALKREIAQGKKRANYADLVAADSARVPGEKVPVASKVEHIVTPNTSKTGTPGNSGKAEPHHLQELDVLFEEAIAQAQGMDQPEKHTLGVCTGSGGDEPDVSPESDEEILFPPQPVQEPKPIPVPRRVLRDLHHKVEFIKTHSATPILSHEPVRAYACAGLVSEGCVEHDDASHEGGVGLTELHPEVLSKFNFTRRSYYYVTAGVEPDALDGRFLTNGQYNPAWIATMQFENTAYTLKFVGNKGPCDYYHLCKAITLRARKGFFSCPKFISGAISEVGAWATEIGLIAQPQATIKHVTNLPDRGLRTRSLKGVKGASRARWGMHAHHAPEDLRGPYHTLFIENADNSNSDPNEVLKALKYEKAMLEREHGKRGYCAPKMSTPKTCASCGESPPKGKYKWKHRQCRNCQRKLKSCGAISTMGLQIQQNLTVAKGHPGCVHLNSSTLPPKKEKWAKVHIPKDAIKVHKSDVPWLRHTGDGTSKMHSVEKEDLSKIDITLERPKRECVLAGIGVSGCYPMVTRKGFYARMQALIGRAYLQKPDSSSAAWEVMAKMKQCLLPNDALDGERFSIDFWLTTMPSRRRRALERAHKEYKDSGGLRDKDLTFSAFVKQELLAGYKKFGWGDARPLEESIARMIMAPKDKAHIVAGPVIKPKLERLKRHWGPDNWLFYGATTPEKLQGWLDSSITGCEDGEVFAFWCDYSMFDCTHSAESMDLVESFYSEMRTDPEFARLINAWRAPKGRMGELSYKAAIMLASGRDDTSLMNALLNGLVMGLSVAAAVAGVELESLQKEHLRFAESRVRISICGDDTLGFLPKHLWVDRARIMRDIQVNIARFGLVTKLDCTSFLGSAVYLGMRPYNVPTPTGRRWLWGRTVGRAAFKLGWMLDPSKGDAAAWATGVADSVVRTQPYVPVLSDLARQTLKLREGARRTPVAIDENKPWTNWTVREEVKNLTYDRETIHALVKSYSTPTLYGGDEPICTPLVEDFYQTIAAIQDVPCLPYVIDDLALRFMCVTDDC